MFSNKNKIYHNNFFENSAGDFSNNYWDDGKVGNYWDDYEGFDILPPWGIGDIWYFIQPFPLINHDRRPLMQPYDL